MHNKIGSQLKTIAIVIRVIGLIAAFILAIACWGIAGNINSYNDTLRNIMIGAGFVVGLLVAIPVVIGSLILEGFGELIVITDDNNDCLRKLAGVPVKNHGNVANNGYYNNSNSNASDTWVCAKCGKPNRASGNFCVGCGNRRA